MERSRVLLLVMLPIVLASLVLASGMLDGTTNGEKAGKFAFVAAAFALSLGILAIHIARGNVVTETKLQDEIARIVREELSEELIIDKLLLALAKNRDHRESVGELLSPPESVKETEALESVLMRALSGIRSGIQFQNFIEQVRRQPESFEASLKTVLEMNRRDVMQQTRVQLDDRQAILDELNEMTAQDGQQRFPPEEKYPIKEKEEQNEEMEDRSVEKEGRSDDERCD